MGTATYRADIDGLRALAVGSVVLYHLGFPISGGFTGVDVFFVISGYLITRILRDELEASRFSLRGFYERRIRRIFPALFVVLLASCIAASLLLLPNAFERFGRSLLAALAFGSNLLFWSESGYFDAAAESKPLLHTWSLAVEEQFYLFFPLLLILLARQPPRYQRIALWGLSALSFLLALFWVRRGHASEAFYLFPARGWELMVGALLAFDALPPVHRRAWRQLLSLVGLGLLGLGFFALNEHSRFPGPAALLPCLGAALLIHSGRQGDTWAHWLLAQRPLVFIGLLSYSLYLWHWPVVVFYRESLLGELDLTPRLILLATSLLLAWASWRWIETPFRRPDQPLGRWPPFKLLGTGTALLGSVALVITLSGGLPVRLPAEAVRLESALVYDNLADYRRDRCFLSWDSQDPQLDAETCLSVVAGQRNVLLVGDSHAAQLWAGLSATYPNIHFLQASVSGCKPVLVPNGESRCYNVIGKVLRQFIPEHPLDAVIVAARWRMEALDPLLATVRELSRYTPRVIVMGRVMEYRNPLPQLLAIGRWRGDAQLAPSHRTAESQAVDVAYEKAFASNAAGSAEYVSLQNALCNHLECTTTDEQGWPIQFDYGHLNGSGSRLLFERLKASGFTP